MNKTATCPQCLYEFSYTKRGRDKVYCSRSCFVKNYNSRADRKIAISANNIKYKWGLSLEQYNELMLTGCQVCGSQEKLNIDHDHKCCPPGTQRTCGRCIRGVLCRSCNLAEGMLMGRPELAIRLAEYMTNNGRI